MNNFTTIYLWDYEANRIVESFDTEDALIVFLSKHYAVFFGDTSELNLTGHDVRVNWDNTRTLRKYRFFDEQSRTIDVRIYQKAVEQYMPKPTTAHINHEDLQYGYILCNDGHNYRFRCDPVPGLKCASWKAWFRHPRTTQEYRMMAIPEYKQFVRDHRKRIPTAWDDEVRVVQRSWKAQSKNKHQWQSIK